MKIMTFHRLFKAELIKTRGTHGFLITLLIPLLITILQFSIFYFKHAQFAGTGMNPWGIMGRNLFNFLGIIVMPMYVVVIAYLVNFTEHQANSWKYLFALPIPKFQIYSAKSLLALLWLLLFCVLLSLLFLASGQLLSQVRPDIGFQDYTITRPFLAAMIKLFLCGVGILSIQFFLSIYWKDFIRPVGIGLGLTIAGFILSSWEHIYIFPYALPNLVGDDFSELRTHIITRPVLSSLLYGVVFFYAGYHFVSRKEIL